MPVNSLTDEIGCTYELPNVVGGVPWARRPSTATRCTFAGLSGSRLFWLRKSTMPSRAIFNAVWLLAGSSKGMLVSNCGRSRKPKPMISRSNRRTLSLSKSVDSVPLASSGPSVDWLKKALKGRSKSQPPTKAAGPEWMAL